MNTRTQVGSQAACEAEAGAVKAAPAGLQPFQQRIIDEKTELDKKIEKLDGFCAGAAFKGLPVAEQNRLYDQLEFMDGYSHVLGLRIAAFGAQA